MITCPVTKRFPNSHSPDGVDYRRSEPPPLIEAKQYGSVIYPANEVENWKRRARSADKALAELQVNYGKLVAAYEELIQANQNPPAVLDNFSSRQIWRRRALNAESEVKRLNEIIASANRAGVIEAAQRDVCRERYEKLVIEYEKVLAVINNSTLDEQQRAAARLKTFAEKEFPARALRFALPKLPRFF